MAKRKKKISGLGDVVKVVTDTLGIEQCNDCKQRQTELNRLFPFKRVKPMTEAHKEELKDFFGDNGKGTKVINDKQVTFTKDEIAMLNRIYSETFRIENTCDTCSGVIIAIVKDLNKLYINS